MFNPYETLGIPQTATTEEIEAAYQKMAALHHEELAANPKGELASSLQAARSLLSKPASREIQDSLIALLASQAQNTPVQKAPVYEAPVQDAPVYVAPVQNAPVYETPVQNAPVYEAPVQNAPVYEAPVQNAPVYEAPVEPVHPPKQVTKPEPKTANAPQGASNEGDLLRNVKKPVINWQEMDWFNRDYSGLRENIQTHQPGLKKAFFGIITFFSTIVLLAVYADTYDLSWAKGWPVNMVFAIGAGIAWIKYYKYAWSKRKYLVAMGIFTAFMTHSILFGEHEGSSAVMAVILCIISLVNIYIGNVAVINFRRWSSISSSRRIIRKKLSAKQIKSAYSWGEVGNLDNAVDKFGAQEIALGAAGEQFTAEFMQELLKIPGTRIFHGLEFPGSFNGDVDHAIINGDKIVFVDSKLWKAGHYRWQWDGVIEREDKNGKTPINSNFHTAVMGYKKKLPEAQIRSKILIYSGSGRPVTVDNSNAEKPHSPSAPVTELTNAQDFFREVGDWFSEGTPGYINKNLVSALYSKLKI